MVQLGYIKRGANSDILFSQVNVCMSYLNEAK